MEQNKEKNENGIKETKEEERDKHKNFKKSDSLCEIGMRNWYSPEQREANRDIITKALYSSPGWNGVSNFTTWAPFYWGYAISFYKNGHKTEFKNSKNIYN
jgi:hypothetical protein